MGGLLVLEAHEKAMVDKSIFPISDWGTREYNLNSVALDPIGIIAQRWEAADDGATSLGGRGG